MKPEDMNDKGVERTMIAIYAQASNDLISAYRSCNEDKIRALERWIMSDPYGFISDEEGVLRAIRIKTAKGGWVKCPEFAKSEKFDEKRYEI